MRSKQATKAESLLEEASTIVERAEAEGRDQTDAEYTQVQGLLTRAKRLQADGKVAAEIDRMLGTTPGERASDGSGRAFFGSDAGQAFVQSEGYKRVANGVRGQQFSTGPVEVPLLTKGTILEGTGAPGTGTGGGFVPSPDVRPGVVQALLAPPLGVADLFGSQLVTTNTVRYVVEGAGGTIGSGITNAAAGVAEAGTKPESTLVLSTQDEPVKKLATTCVVSDEVLDDAAAATGFINGELTRFIKIREETSLLRGAGTDDLVGVMDSSRGINIYSAGTVDNNAVALAKVIANTRGSSYVEPDAVVMSPGNWLTTRLLTDTNEGFYGDGPFAPPSQGQPGMFGGFLWGKPVILSDAIGAGTALVGNFGAAATLYRKGGVTVEATNSHGELFVQDLVTFRAEQREALAVLRPDAFTEVRGLS